MGIRADILNGSIEEPFPKGWTCEKVEPRRDYILGAATRDISAGEAISVAFNPDKSLDSDAIRFCDGVTIADMPVMQVV